MLALRYLLENLTPGRPYAWQEADGGLEPFTEILPTTWRELERQRLVKPLSFNRFELTPSGWIAALKATGRFDEPDMKEKAGRLTAALKRRVAGRKHDGGADRTTLAQEPGASTSSSIPYGTPRPPAKGKRFPFDSGHPRRARQSVAMFGGTRQ